MAGDPFGRGAAATGAADPFGRGTGGTAPAPTHGTFFGNLLHDAEGAVTGIVPGVVHAVEHPIGAAKAFAHQEAQTYGPLVHGDLGKFYANFHAHPLGPILDAVSVATLGAGAASRVAELGGLNKALQAAHDAGTLGKTGEAARAALSRERVPLTVPDLAKQAGQEGNDVVLRKSAANPLQRGRQVGVNKALNRARPDLPLVGSEARLARAVGRRALKEGSALALKGQAFQAAFGRLNDAEKAAWHLRARQLDPAGYKQLLEAKAVADPLSTEAAMVKRLSDSKLNNVYTNPTKRLSDALTKGGELSDLMTAEKVKRGYISDTAAAEAPYRAQRILSGAHFVEETSGRLGKSPALDAATAERDRVAAAHEHALQQDARWNAEQKTKDLGLGSHMVLPVESPLRNRIVRLSSRLEEAQAKVDRLSKSRDRRVEPTGLVGGKPIPDLAAELAAKGEAQPFYVPDTAATGKLPGQSWRPQATAPMALKSAKQNKGTLLSSGMINLHGDALGAEHARFARHVQRSDIHNALMEVAAKEPAHGVPLGYRYLKTTAGEKSAPYTVQAAAGLKDALSGPEDKGSLLERFTTKDANHPDIAIDGEGHRLIVPDKVANLLAHEAAPTRGLVHTLLYNKPTTLWKHLVLGLRPAYAANIILSQHILGALQAAPGEKGLFAYINHAVPGARLGKLTDATVADVMPEQAHGSFASSAGYTANKGLNAAARAYQGVMPATLKAENWLRRLMIEGWAKSEPEVQAALKQNGGDINLALRQVAKSDPHIIDEISQRVDHAQGNYRTYSPAEQKLRQVIPFYGWDRHIVQSTYRILAERPALATAGIHVGQQGQQVTQQTLGALPSYLQGVVKLSGLPGFMGSLNGATPVLNTKAVGPFEADAGLLRIVESLVHGKAGASSEEASSINPLLAATIEQITGRNLVTGAPVKDKLPLGFLNVPVRAALGVPQARLVEALIGSHPLGQSKHPVSPVDWRLQLASLLGVPVKKLDLAQAHKLAQLEGTPPK